MGGLPARVSIGVIPASCLPIGQAPAPGCPGTLNASANVKQESLRARIRGGHPRAITGTGVNGCISGGSACTRMHLMSPWSSNEPTITSWMGRPSLSS